MGRLRCTGKGGGPARVPTWVRPATVLAVLTTAAFTTGCSAHRQTSAIGPSLAPSGDEAGSASPSTRAAGSVPASRPIVTAPPLAPFTGDPFFDPGDAEPGEPGEIIRARPLGDALGAGQGWQVLHWSRTAEDRAVAVSATIVAPKAATRGDRPVFAYAHSTTGMGDQCALTNQLTGGTGREVMLLPAMLDMGMTIVAPDYQGLGTPGDHAYLTNQASGRNVLDAIRAARHLEGTGVTEGSPAVVWGHSQGGGAAAFAAELQPTYAPDVNLVGAIAGAPTSDLTPMLEIMTVGPSQWWGFIPMIIAGLRTGYPELASDDGLLSDAGRTALEAASTSCVNDAVNLFADTDLVSTFEGLPLTGPRWQAAFAANRAGDRFTPVPILIYNGSEEAVELTDQLLQRYCALGVTAAYRVYQGRGHMDSLDDAVPDIVAFTRDRLRGVPAPSDCR